MNIVVDYGNSAAKVGIFDHQNLMEKMVFHSAVELQHYLSGRTFSNAIISSVKTNPEVIASWIQNAARKFILNEQLSLPVNNLYRTPSTLGVDRLAAVCGAQQLFPFQNCLVIDAGTCIKFDVLDNEGNYHGGAISPGVQMRFKALHTFTARLPLITVPTGNVKLIGDSTESCIQSGVVNGVLAEVDEIVRQYQVQFESLRVILSGGDAVLFENKLKASIFASPELVLVGLNSILNHNVIR